MAANMTTGDDDKDDADLYTMDDDKDDDDGEGGGGMPTVIVEDEPGTVNLTPLVKTAKTRKKGVLALEEAEVDDEGISDDDDEDGDDDGRGWEDAYEQEV